jgi:hypothetical protein
LDIQYSMCLMGLFCVSGDGMAVLVEQRAEGLLILRCYVGLSRSSTTRSAHFFLCIHVLMHAPNPCSQKIQYTSSSVTYYINIYCFSRPIFCLKKIVCWPFPNGIWWLVVK